MSPNPDSLPDLRDTIKSLAGASTADLIGIAPGSEFSAEELGALGEAFGQVNSLVVLAQHITDPVQRVTFRTGSDYRGSRVVTCLADAMLRDACWRVAHTLEASGWKAALARNLRYGASDPRHRISYKKAAVLAGLGALGKSQLLIHPEWGPWIWLRVVVTDARLAPDAPIDFSPCEGCSRCIEACPVGALSPDGIDRDICEKVAEMPQSPIVLSLSPHGHINCEECLRACPVGTAPPRLTPIKSGP